MKGADYVILSERRTRAVEGQMDPSATASWLDECA
jgi:hypothetical protein